MTSLISVIYAVATAVVLFISVILVGFTVR
jgi:hypothetical protein